ncbi:MAG: efflux RND transporter periplasmic adaptor subunit, partial [Deltaproteobacteria bacterium]|nr:efflux RND transporter periplasmic adaptor subunit [Nannocystaceae bacterium]
MAIVATPPESIELSEAEPEKPAVRRHRRWIIAAVVGALCVALGLGAHALADGEPSPEPEAERQRDVPRLEDGHIVYSEAFSQRAGLSLARVEVREVVPLVRASGTVAFDPRRVAVVGSRIAARIVSVEVVPGQQVEKGDVLARLEAAELAHVQADVEVLRARTSTAVAEAERKRQLADEGIT